MSVNGLMIGIWGKILVFTCIFIFFIKFDRSIEKWNFNFGFCFQSFCTYP